MKKMLFSLLLILTTTTLTFGQEFLGIKVEGKMNEVVEKFKLKGLKVIPTSSKNAVGMKGIVANKNIELFINCTPKTKIVWSFGVYLPVKTTWTSLKSEYEDFYEVLRKKYGEPESNYNFFSSPYEEGDGYEMTAVAVEKCTYSAFWPNVYIEISKWKQVKINYQNSVNADRAKEEEEELNSTIFK